MIFIVDDADTNLLIAEAALETQYQVMTLPSAAKMFTLLEKITPDLILLDIEMPEMNGFEAIKRLKSHHSYTDIPVIFLTGHTDIDIEVRGFELGAIDFISKPFSPPILLNRIKTHININEIIRERTAKLLQLQEGIIIVLSNMIENRDRTMGRHVDRTTAYIKILIKAMEERDVYADEIRKWDIETAISSTRLHDVGKIILSDLLLNKPGKLTDKEYEEMKVHTSEGERIIDEIISFSGDEEFLHNARMFAGYHHERWDGSGYPRGLKGTEIPLQGRIMAIVDVYDALVNRRSYKEPFTEEEAIRIIGDEAGNIFDPKIVEVFLEVKDLFKEVTYA
ncbi:MAG: response regulator [Treponema sp.]|nr:response regulator [Treponema sp.]